MNKIHSIKLYINKMIAAKTVGKKIKYQLAENISFD